jgi:hypothetical protein
MLQVRDRLLQRADRTLAEVKSEAKRHGGQGKSGDKFPHDAILSANELYRMLKKTASGVLASFRPST